MGKYEYNNTSSGDSRGQVSWNIAAYHAIHISNLVRKATDLYLDGNISQWFWTLSALRENINHDLNENEQKELDEIELQAKKFSGIWNRYKRSLEEGKETTEFSKMKSEYTAVVRKYMRDLMFYLKELGYFPNKEDRTKLGF